MEYTNSHIFVPNAYVPLPQKGGRMTHWVKPIVLKSGEIVTERELRADENLFEGPAPVVGDKLTVVCRGRSFEAKVIWGNWPERERDRAQSEVVPLRVEEI